MDENDGYAIPFREAKLLIEHFPYASQYRVAFTLLALTGMRIRELDSIGSANFNGSTLAWKLGKNQKRYRHVELPGWFLEELRIYLANTPHTDRRLFLYKAEVLRRVLAKIRPRLGAPWQARRAYSRRGMLAYEYKLQLKGLRHSFATFKFYQELQRWGSAEVALCFTAKEMRHSTHRLTAMHYVEDLDALEVQKYRHQSIGQALAGSSQRKLIEFI